MTVVALFFLCVFLLDEASDQEWSRYLVVMLVDFAAHLIYIAVGFDQVVKKSGIDSSIKAALLASLSLSTCTTAGIAYLVFTLGRKLYLSNNFLAYHNEPQLQVTERLEFL